MGSGPLLPDNELQVTASIGVAICPDHAASERQLMAFADAAMYQAKESGRNAFVLFADWMNDSAEQQFRLLADLRRAIGSEQLFLHYQPKIRVATQKVAGAEALIRWKHPEHGLIPTGPLHPPGRTQRRDQRDRSLGTGPGLPAPLARRRA